MVWCAHESCSTADGSENHTVLHTVAGENLAPLSMVKTHVNHGDIHRLIQVFPRLFDVNNTYYVLDLRPTLLVAFGKDTFSVEAMWSQSALPSPVFHWHLYRNDKHTPKTNTLNLKILPLELGPETFPKHQFLGGSKFKMLIFRGVLVFKQQNIPSSSWDLENPLQFFNDFAHIPWENTPNFPKPHKERNSETYTVGETSGVSSRGMWVRS